MYNLKNYGIFVLSCSDINVLEFIKKQILQHHIDYHFYQTSPDKDFKTDWDEELKKLVSYIAHLKNKIKVIEWEIRNDINKKDNARLLQETKEDMKASNIKRTSLEELIKDKKISDRERMIKDIPSHILELFEDHDNELYRAHIGLEIVGA